MVGELQWVHVHVKLINGICGQKFCYLDFIFAVFIVCKYKVPVFYGEYSMGN